jgi:hypothetical protein
MPVCLPIRMPAECPFGASGLDLKIMSRIATVSKLTSVNFTYRCDVVAAFTESPVATTSLFTVLRILEPV